MINTQLIDYIKNLKKKGISDDAIKNHLIKYNYSLDLINECFKEINTSEHNNEKKKLSLNYILVFTLVVIILFFVLGFLALNKNNNLNLKSFKNENCKDVSLSFFKKNENEIVCVFPDNSKVQMIIENKGLKKIDSIDIFINNQKIENLKINLEPNNIFTKVVETKTNNNVNELKIIPIIENNIQCDSIIKKELNKC
ncbi:MAG: hypothetical protein QXR96_02060 [Candidatus Woesearchaeota archaeon]